ncbi:MAG: rhomboid family intramembrane serine protease [Bacteroidia bacterium]|nr:rhomboid family intramembrane serine protease [Bacteroidia bacterium]
MGLLYLFRNMPPAVKNIFFINLLFFLGAWVSMDVFHYNLTYVTGMKYFGSVLFKPYQIFTHMFMHGSFSHILFNMFGLLMFGSMIERYIGTKRFLILYLLSGLGAAFLEQSYWAYRVYECVGEVIPEKALQNMALSGLQLNNVCQSFVNWIATPMVGASGAIYGLLVAYGMFFPNSELMFIFIPYPIKAKYMIPGIILLDLFLGLSSFNWDNVAHFAHLGGALTGFVLIKIWNRNRTRLY